MASAVIAAARPMWTPARALLLGGLTVGVLDGLDALVFFGLRGVPPARVFQGIASGLLGRSAFAGGMATALLGVFLHFFIAFAVVTAYHLAARRLPALTQRPWIYGPLYGFLVYGHELRGHTPFRDRGRLSFDRRSSRRPPDPCARCRTAGGALRASRGNDGPDIGFELTATRE